MITADARFAHRELEARLRPFVARRVSACDVDDVLQEVFLRMEKSVGALRDRERFGPWIARVARSAVADHRRSRARHPVSTDEPPEIAVELVNTADENAVERELASYVVPLIAMLESPYRETLTLTEIQGMKHRDAAAMLGVSVAAMKSRVQRGRSRLRALLEKCCNIATDRRGRVIACTARSPNPISCTCRFTGQ